MHELTHLIGFCADAHSHFDLLDALSYMGFSEMMAQASWVTQAFREWLRR